MWQNELEAMIAAGGAPCRACGQRMLKADGCTWTHVKCGNRYYRRIKYGEDGAWRCPLPRLRRQAWALPPCGV